MPDSYYQDDTAESSPKPSPGGGKDEESAGASALLPKSLLAGKDFKVGDEVVLKIVHEYEDEVEVEYSHDEPDKKSENDEPTSSDDEIDMMASGKSMKGMNGMSRGY